MLIISVGIYMIQFIYAHFSMISIAHTLEACKQAAVLIISPDIQYGQSPHPEFVFPVQPNTE